MIDFGGAERFQLSSAVGGEEAEKTHTNATFLTFCNYSVMESHGSTTSALSIGFVLDRVV
jgi:hypothetical protein